MLYAHAQIPSLPPFLWAMIHQESPLHMYFLKVFIFSTHIHTYLDLSS